MQKQFPDPEMERMCIAAVERGDHKTLQDVIDELEVQITLEKRKRKNEGRKDVR
jgi:hypothetical protein